MRPRFDEHLLAQRDERQARAALRHHRVVEHRAGTRFYCDGRELIGFCSNDYLGLADHPDVVAALRSAASEHGVGSTAAHLVCGHHRLHQQLEEAVAEWLGYSRGLLFGSGYLANLGVLQALLAPGDVTVQDKLNHACLIDGARLAGAELCRYRHADVDGARRQLQSRPEARALLATDGVFSMDGDAAPLAELAALAQAERALLYVDDAHGVGVLGANGEGTSTWLGLDAAAVPLQLVTLSKALGGYGAIVVGNDALIDAIVQGARSYLFTTALPPPLASASLAAVRIARDDAARREHLHANIARFRQGAAQLGLPLLPSSTPIQPLLIGDNAATLAAARRLEAGGFLVAAIRPPTVPAGKARLRVTLSAAHRDDEIDRLLEALARALLQPARPAAPEGE